jgi:hypothetical protein
LLTRMTGNSLHMQWPLTSQLHGSVSQSEQWVFRYGSNSTPNYATYIQRSCLAARQVEPRGQFFIRGLGRNCVPKEKFWTTHYICTKSSRHKLFG